MASSKLEKDLNTLSTVITNTVSLIRAFQSSKPSLDPPKLGPSPQPNPLAVLSDASKILKAQTTKLSLLLLNKPFTPSEIAYVLKALNGSCLPALATVLDLCPTEQYTHFLRRYIQTGLSSIWTESLALVGSIPRDKAGVEKLEKEGTLLSTGVLWATCDKLIRVGAEGVAVIASDTVNENHALLKDAIEELDEWDPEDDEEEDSQDEDGDERDCKSAQHTPTTSDEEALSDGVASLIINPLVALKTRALKKLRLVRLLYPALIKHRIKTFTNIKAFANELDLPTILQARLFDDIEKATRLFTEEADEVAGALYVGDTAEVERRLKALMAAARTCVNSSRTGYDGQEDAFSEWAKTWIARSEELET